MDRKLLTELIVGLCKYVVTIFGQRLVNNVKAKILVRISEEMVNEEH